MYDEYRKFQKKKYCLIAIVFAIIGEIEVKNLYGKPKLLHRYCLGNVGDPSRKV